VGSDRFRRSPRSRGQAALSDSSAVRVLPAVPSFSVDTGFWYSVGKSLGEIATGSVVRVPLGGRRVRGYVVETGAEREGLREVRAISGAAPIFDQQLLDALVWAAHYYVTPLSVMLERAAPPNLPTTVQHPRSADAAGAGAFDDLARSALERRRHPPVAWVDSRIPFEDLADLGRRLSSAGGSVLIVVPTGSEAEAIGARLGAVDEVVVVTPDLDQKSVTRAWASVSQSGGVVVGTPRVASWMVRKPAVFVAVEEGRRAMKERQTPTISVRDLLRARSIREQCPTLFLGPTPSVELLGSGAEVRRAGGRAWPLVEVVDTRSEPPGRELLSETAKQALRSILRRGGRSFIYAHRHGYAPASRCVSCKELRRCPRCGARPDQGDACKRCGEPLGGCTACGGRRFEPLGAGVGRVEAEIRRFIDPDKVAIAPGGAPVLVGTERDLADLDQMDLVVLVDADGLIFSSHYRAAEEALRIGARLASRLVWGSGRRLLVQTQVPSHPVILALRRADPVPFLHEELTIREEHGYPPAGDMILLSVKGPSASLEELRLPEASVMGPVDAADGLRWLIQGRDLGPAKQALRTLIQKWRDADLTVRIDVDPIDL